MEENSLEQLQNELTDKFDELFPRAGEKKDLFESVSAAAYTIRMQACCHDTPFLCIPLWRRYPPLRLPYR